MPYHIYILTNKPQGTLYIGVTNNLLRRVYEHKYLSGEGFSQKYNLKKLVYYEQYDVSQDAITREKQLKNWHRVWKIQLIESFNPEWKDLYDLIVG